jgi:transcription elongation factor Elf1
MWVKYFAEICCDECNDVIHNHFDCPQCGTEYAGTDIYGEIDYDYKFVTCQECHHEFQILDLNTRDNMMELDYEKKN